MILVDVFFPELNRNIDFQLDENVRGWEIAEEIATMAGRSCGRSFEAEENAILLYSMDTRQGLNLDCSLKENGVKSGDRLLFV